MVFSMSELSSHRYSFFCHIFVIEIQKLYSNSKFSKYNEPILQDARQQTKYILDVVIVRQRNISATHQ